MISINNLSFYYGDRAIYDQVNLHIKPKDRIGLVGLNGAGKSTLLKLIHGDLRQNEGSIEMAKDVTIGFLNQDLLSFESDLPILTVAMQAFEREMELQQRIDELCQKLETDYSDELVEELTAAQEEFEVKGGYSMQSKAEKILAGLGFPNSDLARPLSEFSGGWRMRVMLGKLLLMQPSLLMLDEPTNHLDLPSISWLEDYLSTYQGAVLIVSHDRIFLEKATNVTVESNAGALNHYAGNYQFYLEEKELRAEIQQNAYENQQQKIKKTEEFIGRFRAKASKARQVQSKVKLLDKMDKVDAVVDETPNIDFDFRFKTQPGKIISELKAVEKAYGDQVILDGANLTIARGDKIALVGANGTGKTTILRMVAGVESPTAGERKMGFNVLDSFYAQHQLESLNPEAEILEELKSSGLEKTEQQIRTILGAFLFGGEEVKKKIKVLSGGERSRVALARTLLTDANFLLLDEPTNHLDMLSVNVLAEALQRYEGTYLVVSHNRDFIAKIANKIWYIENKQVKEYPGTLDEYMVWQAERAKETPTEPKATAPDKEKNQKASGTAKSKPKKATAEQDKREEQAFALELEIEEIETKMADPSVFNDKPRFEELVQALENKKKEINQLLH